MAKTGRFCTEDAWPKHTMPMHQSTGVGLGSRYSGAERYGFQEPDGSNAFHAAIILAEKSAHFARAPIPVLMAFRAFSITLRTYLSETLYFFARSW